MYSTCACTASEHPQVYVSSEERRFSDPGQVHPEHPCTSGSITLIPVLIVEEGTGIVNASAVADDEVAIGEE